MKKKIIILGLVWPEPTSSAAGTRMVQLIRLFLEQNFEVIFASAAQESDFSFDLEALDITKRNIELNNSSFDLFLQEVNPDYVLFDRFITEEQFGWRVVANCPNAIRILDTEDLHCLRYARQNAIKKNIQFQLEDILQEETTIREIASIYRCDLSLIISDFEMEILPSVFRIDKALLYYLPLFYIPKKEYLSYNDRKDFVFIGNFLHEPNCDAVLQLKSLWKSIKAKLPEANMNIYGAYTPQKISQLHNEKDGFLIKGRAVDALQVIEKSRVLLAPLRFGAGIKGKLLEAMVVGTPSITTSIGAEGISKLDKWNGFVTDDIAVFIDQAIKTYLNEPLWNEKQKVGFEILNSKYNQSNYLSVFFEYLTTIETELKEHRIHNFMGKLLHSNQFASTKYMSKWIEEKNKQT